ncbi:MAG: hypothetical protein ABFS34_05455 [Gemmatimonadota bacterium]
MRSSQGATAWAFAAAAAVVTAAPCALGAQQPADTAAPMAGFERLIGAWRSGSTVQVFEWGPGRLAVRARSHLTAEEGSRQVSEGLFLHDPLRDEVRGYFVAVEMPVSYFEYSVDWQGDVLVAELTTTDVEGRTQRFIERWSFVEADRFLWTLLAGADGADSAPIMSAEFERVVWPPENLDEDAPEGER